VGGKSDNTTTPPPIPESPQFDPTMMMQMMGMMMQQGGMFAPPPVPSIPAAPAVTKDPAVDWTEKNKELANKVRADYQTSQSKKRGRTDTILTSPLLDEELGKSTSLIAP